MNSEARDFGGLRILVADDSDFIRTLTGRVLEKVGATQVLFAADGHQAFKAIQDSSPPIDIIFCDLQMPGLDGVEVARQTALLPRPPAFIIISAESADALSAATEQMRSLGIEVLGALSKPLAREPIVKILESFLAKAVPPSSGPTKGGSGA